MSQQKVDKYKEFKKNQKERKSKKRNALIWKIVGLVLAAGLVVALAITGWNTYDNWKQAQPIYTRDELIIGDIAGISETEAETTEAAGESTEAAESTEASAESTEADTTAAN